MTLLPVQDGELTGKNILITGAARRIGQHLALSLARAGATIIIHYRHSTVGAIETQQQIQSHGGEAHILQLDLNELNQVVNIFSRINEWGPLFALINNASVFEPLSVTQTTLEVWQTNLNVNLTAPFILSRAFALALEGKRKGRIINILDWRALRPGDDHFPYTISKAGLAALTSSLAVALAPNITVNGLALGAILPPIQGAESDDIIKNVPSNRWGNLEEVSQTCHFLLTGPEYITGEIIHLDGGRHLI